MGGEKAAGSRAGLYDPALYDTACVSSLTAMGRSNGRGPAASGVARTLTASERVRLTPHCSSISPPVSLRSNEAVVAEGLEHPGARPRAHEHLAATQSSDRPDLARAAARRCIKPVFWLRDIVSSMHPRQTGAYSDRDGKKRIVRQLWGNWCRHDNAAILVGMNGAPAAGQLAH